MLMDIVWFLLIGLVAGWLASLITKREGKGIVNYLIIGIIGALLGRMLVSPVASRCVWAARRACHRHGRRRHFALCVSKSLVNSHPSLILSTGKN